MFFSFYYLSNDAITDDLETMTRHNHEVSHNKVHRSLNVVYV